MKRLLLMLLVVIPLLTRAQIASFTISADTVCQDSCITFINTSTGHVDSIRWSITGHSLTNAGSDTITVCFPSAGSDTVKLYVYDSTRQDTATQVFRIKQIPHPSLIDTGDCGLKVLDVYQSYKWQSSSPFFLDDTTNYLKPGSYGSYYVVVDSNGCLGESDSVMPCGGGVNNVNNLNAIFNVFPNPAYDKLNIESNYTISTFVTSNLIGHIVYFSEYNTKQVEVDIADLPAGIYIIRINGTEVRKFVKE